MRQQALQSSVVRDLQEEFLDTPVEIRVHPVGPLSGLGSPTLVYSMLCPHTQIATCALTSKHIEAM